MSVDKPLEGKTKIIFDNGDGTVIVRSKDDITAGDGDRHDTLEGKAAASTRTTTNVFKYLERCGIKTHFMERLSPTEFKARKMKMIPLELVVRRIKTGSHMKRHPDDVEGSRFDELETEFYWKEDRLHDPHVMFMYMHDMFGMNMHWAGIPNDGMDGKSFIGWRPAPCSEDVIKRLDDLTVRVFRALEHAFESLTFDGQAAVLVDFKIECGFDAETGEILVADVIDNDSWRVWLGGKKDGQVDKQVYREIVGDMDPDQRKSLKKLFGMVAETSDQFPDVEPPMAS